MHEAMSTVDEARARVQRQVGQKCHCGARSESTTQTETPGPKMEGWEKKEQASKQGEFCARAAAEVEWREGRNKLWKVCGQRYVCGRANKKKKKKTSGK